MEHQSLWPAEPRRTFSNEFKLQMIKLASQPGASVAQIARENGLNDNLLFKWLRLWQNEGRVSRRLPAIMGSSPSPALLPVEVMPDPVPSDESNTGLVQLSPLNASSCCVEFRHGKMTLDNPSPELLAVLLRELTGRTMK